MVEEIKAFKTSDGVIWEDELLAWKHEKESLICKLLTCEINKAEEFYSESSKDAALQFILRERENLMRIFDENK